ncbi:unnamed protein product [Miscanthus lutarioriparius]|uniref:Protein kinase domain-containing protein n=1 Tax=Miscanthus lutarioriparius TaxID=422564 RepID=A0A811R465_9POAL|nr:unnamed protein product [Miscanthus lutarioriparius]
MAGPSPAHAPLSASLSFGGVHLSPPYGDRMKRLRGCFNPKDLGTGETDSPLDPPGLVFYWVAFSGGFVGIEHRFAGFEVILFRCFLEAGPTGSEDDDTSFTLTVETFSFEEFSAATDNFSKNLRIGSGGQGIVYEGHLPSIGQRLTSLDFAYKQRAFLREVYVLNSHPHIVKLPGCCSEGTERLLVYEYEEGGTLHQRLSGTFSPKISDFGTAKIAPAGDELIAVASGMVGMVGYMSPEIANQTNPTVMSDTYSFGVVLLELITGKTTIDESKEGEERNLVYWIIISQITPLQAANKKKNGNFEELLDPRLRGSVSRMVLSESLNVVDKCIESEAVGRPQIGEIIKALRHVVSIWMILRVHRHQQRGLLIIRRRIAAGRRLRGPSERLRCPRRYSIGWVAPVVEAAEAAIQASPGVAWHDRPGAQP